MNKYIYITFSIIAFTIAAADTSYACNCMASLWG